MTTKNFIAQKISRTAEIILNGSTEKVFPLFGAFEERKWADDWNPVLIYPSTEIIEEGTTFKTRAHGHGEEEYIWRVTKYEPQKHLIQYLVNTENRFWTITVECKQEASNKTSAEVTYSYIGLNALGNEINKHSLEQMFHRNLKDWEEEINNYLKNNSL